MFSNLESHNTSWRVIFLTLIAVPLLLAALYAQQPLSLTMLTTAVSAMLVAACFCIVLPQLQNSALNVIVTLVLLWMFGNYLFANFISFYLQGSGLNQQFFFHFNLTTLTETWGVYWPLSCLYILWSVSLLLAGLQLSQQDAPRPKIGLMVMMFVAVLLNPDIRAASAFSMGMLGYNTITSVDEIDWRRTGLDPAALVSGEHAEPGKNLLMIYMEGLDSIYTDESLFPDLTPNLNRFAATGLSLANMRQVSGSEWTVGGLVSTACGTPLLQQANMDGNTALFSSLLSEADCLGDVLARADYQQVFMGGAALSFAGKGRFFEQHGYDKVLGRNALTPLLADPDYINGWGLFDDSLLQLAEQEFTALAASGEPFNLTLLTVDTHHPNGEPSASCPDYAGIDNSILHAVHCTDYLLGQFIASLEKHPAFADTVVVMLSDHLAMRNNAFDLFPTDYQRKRLFIALNTEQSGTLTRVASPMDVAPTVLDLIAVQHDSSFLAGNSLLSEEHRAITSTRAIDSEISFINSNLLTDQPEMEVFSIAEDGIAPIEPLNNITAMTQTVTGMALTATGPDPYFSLALPQVDSLDVSGGQSIHLAVVSPEPTMLEIYFAAEPDGVFVENQKKTIALSTGLNQVWTALPQSDFYRHIRIDPGQVAGEYRFESLVITASAGDS